MNWRLLITPRMLALMGLALLGAAQARAVEVEAVRDDTYPQLVQGELKSMALTSDGFLLPSYGRRLAGDTRNEIVWDALREKNGTILCATGHHGKLVRLGNEATTQVLATLAEPEITALARLGDGTVLAAAAPTGRIYKLGADDKLTTWTQLNAKFVWRLVSDIDGSVWAVTGTEGRLFHLRSVDGKPQVEEVCKLKSANLLDLWVDHDGLLGEKGDVYIAGQNPGWLYRWRPATRKAEVAFNAQAEEIRRLMPVKGALALALNTERAPSAQALSMTLRMSGSGLLPPVGGAPGTPPPDQSLSQAFSPTQQGNFGQPRSEVVLLDRSGFTRSLWNSPERPIHDLALSPDQQHLLAAAGNNGRLFEIALNGEYSVVADLREDYLTRIVEDDKGYLLAAARNGVVAAMDRTRATEAVYLSRPIDAGKLVKWGHFYWHGELAGAQQAQFAFRVGNDGDADSAFWGDWSAPVAVKPGEAIALPAGPARFAQYKLTFRQSEPAAKPARLEYADLFFIGRNGAPQILQVTAAEAAPRSGGASSSGSSSSSGEGSASGSNSGGGSAPAATVSGQNPGGGRAPRSNPMSVSINWRVIDPNGDTLRYALYFKGVDETAWKLIDKDLSQNQLTLNAGGLADGRYRFRVVANDAQSNPPGDEQHDESVSNEIVVDNTPPAVEAKTVKVEGHRAVVSFEAADKTSLLASVKMDVDNGDAFPVIPVDGVMDQPRETFRVVTKELKAGEHTATFGVTDARGNTTVEKVVFTIAP